MRTALVLLLVCLPVVAFAEPKCESRVAEVAKGKTVVVVGCPENGGFGGHVSILSDDLQTVLYNFTGCTACGGWFKGFGKLGFNQKEFRYEIPITLHGWTRPDEGTAQEFNTKAVIFYDGKKFDIAQ